RMEATSRLPTVVERSIRSGRVPWVGLQSSGRRASHQSRIGVSCVVLDCSCSQSVSLRPAASRTEGLHRPIVRPRGGRRDIKNKTAITHLYQQPTATNRATPEKSQENRKRRPADTV